MRLCNFISIITIFPVSFSNLSNSEEATSISEENVACDKESATINIDFIVPIGVSEFKEWTGELSFKDENTGFAIDYTHPSHYVHTGFEFRPGVTLHF